MNKLFLLSGLALVAAASQASVTIATFQDPAPNSSTPLFDWDMGANTLSGSWTGAGFTMDTPGFTGGGSVANTHFLMGPVALTVVIPNVLYMMGAGTIDFYTTNLSSPFFTITFNGGTFLNPLNSSASSLNGDVVNFAGPNVPGGLSNQQFAFSLANPVLSSGHMTYTSSFTSSADVVPEPLTLVALATGLAAVARRRKA